MSSARNRAWRRFKNNVNKGKGMGSGLDEFYKPEKNWKLLYLRKCKLIRAKQLGFDYPIKSQRQLLEQELSFEE